MANTWIEPPPPQRGMGCFAKGCLMLLVFAFFLIVAGCAGLYWGYRHHSALLRGAFWAKRTHVIADAPQQIPTYQAQPVEIREVKQRWANFEATMDRQEPAEIELTANDLNGLIANNKDLRGHAFVSVEGNRLRFQLSVPLQEYIRQQGYYANADVIIQFDGAQSVDHPRLTGITINGESLPSDVLNWKYDSRPLGNYLSEFRDTSNVGTVEVRDDKVILRSRAR
jgi:hypothetical protein